MNDLIVLCFSKSLLLLLLLFLTSMLSKIVDKYVTFVPFSVPEPYAYSLEIIF